MFTKQIDILAIGDVTIDAFIHLTEHSKAHLECDATKKHCELAIPFGDKVPFESMTEVAGVGNSPNAAVSSARLGLNVALIANVGNDRHGKVCLDALKKNNVDTRYIHIEKDKPTNYHYVLWFDIDRTILIKHQEYNYHLPSVPAPRWIYLSSLGSNSADYHDAILDYLKNNPSIKLAFQPGTFQMELGTEKLKDIYHRTQLFICNLEESQLILKTDEKDLAVLCKAIFALGPEIVLITDGANGAYMFDGSRTYFMPIYPDVVPPIERTGCGDAFSSTFMAALALGKTPLEALTWAPINSMSVVEHVGAQAGLLTRKALEDFLAKAPASYKPTIYNSFLESQS